MNHDEYMLLLSERTTLEQLIDETPEEDVLDRGSLQTRLEIVQRQIAAEAAHREPARVRLTFRGGPVVGSHGTFAQFATKALNDFTESVVTMAASLDSPLGARGPLPNRELHKMLITSTALGSFGFELEEHRIGQLELHEASPMAQALERTHKLLQGTQGTDDELADSALEVDDRALDKIRTFLQTLVDSEATCTMTTDRTQVSFKDLAQVRASVGRLSRENIREEEQSLVGEITGALPDGRTFEFRLSETGQIIRGKVGPGIPDPDVLNDMRHKAVTVRVTTTRVGAGRPRYVLVEVVEDAR